jgi:hypothetical protein
VGGTDGAAVRHTSLTPALVKKLNMKTVVVGLILAFLLFTPQGQFICESAIGSAIVAVFPPPPPIHHVAAPAPAPDPRCVNLDPKNDYEDDLRVDWHCLHNP